MQYQLRISGKHYNNLKQHLLPGDGKEAVAFALCGRHENEDFSILLIHKLLLLRYTECERAVDSIKWKTEQIIPFLEEAAKSKMAVLKIHSHPGGFSQFSEIDDLSDNELFKSVFGWCDGEGVHGSLVLLPNDKLFGRAFLSNLENVPFQKISIAGDSIKIIDKNTIEKTDDFSLRTIQAFGDGTYAILKGLKIGIIGCSGTGSPTIEQLVRLGVGNLVIIDPDIIENKNLNRILNSKKKDAELKRYKVDVIKEAIKDMNLGTSVITFNKNLFDSREALDDLIKCDIIFGCVDSIDGRNLISQLTNFFLIPFFDLGVRLLADGKGGISNIVGSIHYIQPGLSTLMSRGLYNSDQLYAAGLLRQDPIEFERMIKQDYIQNAEVDRPAVISINMQISSMAINEFLNRIHDYKNETSDKYAHVLMNFCEGNIENSPESSFGGDISSSKWVGRGDCNPFLRMLELE